MIQVISNVYNRILLAQLNLYLLLGAVREGAGEAATVSKTVSAALVVLVAPTTRTALARAAMLLASTTIESPIATAFSLTSSTATMSLAASPANAGRGASFHIALFPAAVSDTEPATLILLPAPLHLAEVAATVRLALALATIVLGAPFYLAPRASAMAAAESYQELLRKLESMGGEKVGRHVVHCRLFNRKTLTGNGLQHADRRELGGANAELCADGYVNQRMFMLRMSQNDDLVYAVLANEKAHGLAPSDNGVEGLMEDCSLLECGLDGANILQQVEIYAFKSDGQFEVQPSR
ncbi:unnamed protein product [Phytophthora lilii]|uniref:Unnamed protein product n=1 Tax=Phytophthora lilii TaxID=2077276 RepID=A0A9W6X439_9STRA|nr:unnamed protein product [Phytophthora lilii]